MLHILFFFYSLHRRVSPFYGFGCCTNPEFFHCTTAHCTSFRIMGISFVVLALKIATLYMVKENTKFLHTQKKSVFDISIFLVIKVFFLVFIWVLKVATKWLLKKFSQVPLSLRITFYFFFKLNSLRKVVLLDGG